MVFSSLSITVGVGEVFESVPSAPSPDMTSEESGKEKMSGGLQEGCSAE